MKKLSYFLAGLGLLLVFLSLYGKRHSLSHTNVRVGQSLPNITLKTLQGKEVSLGQFKGKVLLINFWATWCPPCRREMPYFEKVYKKYRKDFVILAIATDVKVGAVEKFVKKYGITFPVLLSNDEVERLFGISGLPVSFLVDKKGRVVKKVFGEYKDLERDLTFLIR